ncbi:MAG: hypothetical protein HC854_06295 [Flavobacterium sp.]|nr:hypothetical protein [Flavobacterium sp.]
MKENYLEIIRNEFLIENNSVIKYGSIKDGGYFLSPEHVLEADVLFSGGISSNIEFEYDIFRRNEAIKIVMVDPTVSKLKLLSKAIVRVFFFKKEKLRYFINTLTFIMMLRSGRCWHLKKWLSNKTGILDCIEEKIKDFSNKNNFKIRY